MPHPLTKRSSFLLLPCTTASVFPHPEEGSSLSFVPDCRADTRLSGTNGYVVRNLSVLRKVESHQDRQSAWDAGPPKHREPDEAILEHERKRKVEVKCLELQLKLEEEDGYVIFLPCMLYLF